MLAENPFNVAKFKVKFEWGISVCNTQGCYRTYSAFSLTFGLQSILWSKSLASSDTPLKAGIETSNTPFLTAAIISASVLPLNGGIPVSKI